MSAIHRLKIIGADEKDSLLLLSFFGRRVIGKTRRVKKKTNQYEQILKIRVRRNEVEIFISWPSWPSGLARRKDSLKKVEEMNQYEHARSQTRPGLVIVRAMKARPG